MSSITVYTLPGCVQCGATFRALDKKGVRYTVADLSQDPAKADYFRDVLGHAQAPIVTTGSGNWSGFRPDKIATLPTP